MLNSSSSASSSASRVLRLGLDHFEHGADVLLDGQAAKDRGFLRQIADAEPRAPVHRQPRDVVAVELDAAAVGLDQPGDHVEHRGLAGAVRPEQADRLAAPDIDADAAHHLPRAETFFDAVHGEIARARCGARLRLLLPHTLRPLRRGCAGTRHVAHRGITHRGLQHVADAFVERGDVRRGPREAFGAAFRSAPTEHVA